MIFLSHYVLQLGQGTVHISKSGDLAIMEMKRMPSGPWDFDYYNRKPEDDCHHGCCHSNAALLLHESQSNNHHSSEQQMWRSDHRVNHQHHQQHPDGTLVRPIAQRPLLLLALDKLPEDNTDSNYALSHGELLLGLDEERRRDGVRNPSIFCNDVDVVLSESTQLFLLKNSARVHVSHCDTTTTTATPTTTTTCCIAAAPWNARILKPVAVRASDMVTQDFVSLAG